ncbi:DUF697 domain-containing protein [Ruegeria sp. 2205SS24-7]|uniref:YcjF family protein n=1 Tax=Ruegeria discodermiae TaxID=3064389 RepID=UPI0027406C4C|nr:DUF697 domain-containing protein [Ruegeria sp. 2205SS24-7]MDP5218849.1 DUF697 domain-containing protein [Ruegeria sp. 2205SS24-7]
MAVTEVEEVDRVDQAISLSKRYAAYAGGAAFIPVPVVDIAAIGALQLKLVKDLSDLYDVPFSSNSGKAAVTALLSTLVPVQAGITTASFVKAVPLFGTALGVVSAPAFAGAATYAVGRTFTMHFESGGTLLTFDAEKMREFFKSEYETATKSRSSSAKASS